jgi:hypothetical protein
MVINLPKVGNVEFPDNLSPEQFNALLGKLADKYDFDIPKPEVGLGEIAKRGVMRGLGETGIALGDTLPAMVSSAFVHGGGDYATQQMGEAQTSREELERKYPTRFKSYKDIASPFEAVEYAAETFGELLPTAATSIVPGVGFGTVGGRLAARSALGAATKAGPPTRAALAGVEEAAKAGARKGMYGGVFMGSYAQNAPEVFEGIYRETGKFEPGVAALAGGLSAVLDSVAPARVLDSLGPYGKLKVIERLAKDSGAAPKVWKSLGSAATKSAATEGLTEAAQEAIGAYAEEVAGSAKNVMSPENIQRYKEAFVKGAVGGVGFGIPTGVSEYRTAKRDIYTTSEAEKALTAQRAAEESAGTLTPEKAAEYDAQIETARANRQTELEQAFAGLPEFNFRQENLNALQARMDAARPGSKAYAELSQQVEKAKAEAEAERAKQAGTDEAKAAQSAFSKAEPTPGTGGMFKPALEQQRAEQQSGMRGFAFGDMGATNAPIDPVTPKVLKALNISDRSKLGLDLLGVDMSTPDGVRQFIQTIENPSKVGMTSINEENYTRVLDSLYADGRGQEVEDARAEMQVQPTPPKLGQQQAANRAFAFGDQNVEQPISATDGTSDEVVSEPTTRPSTRRTKKSERGGVDIAGENIDGTAGGEAKPAVAVKNKTEAEGEDVVVDTAVDTAPPAASTEGRKTTAGETNAPAVTKTVETPATGKTLKDLTTPDFTDDVQVLVSKLGDKAKTRGLTELENDARAYFGRNMPDFALRSIAHDLVHQDKPYSKRYTEMASFKKTSEPEPSFWTKKEQPVYAGQGGVHAENAAAWVKANLSPKTSAYLDRWIDTYTKESASSKIAKQRQEKRQDIEKGTEEQVKQGMEEAAQEKAEKAKKAKEAKPKTRKERRSGLQPKQSMSQVIKDSYVESGEEDLNNLVDISTGRLNASPEAIGLHDEAHPVVQQELAQGNLVNALNALAANISSDFGRKVASTLVKYVADVKIVYGAKESQYDPKTNTIYLREGATEYEILHEAAHAALSHVLANPSHPVTRQLTKLFEQVKGSVDGAYGATDLQEFAAELWSNDGFRSQLKDMQTDSPILSMWDKIMNVLRTFFGFPPKKTSALDAVDRMLNEIVSVPPESRTGDSMYAQTINQPSVARDVLRAVGAVSRSAPVMNEERAIQWLANAESLGVAGRRVLRKFLNLSALGQVANKVLGKNAIEFSDKVSEMAGYYDQLMEKLQPLSKRLEEYSQSDRYLEWSELVHETSRFDVDPRAPANTYVGSAEKLAKYNEFRAKYAKLNDAEKKLYGDVFSAYKVLHKELKDSLRSNLTSAFPNDPEKAMSVYNKIIDKITEGGIQHYVPLYRRGDFFLKYTDKKTKDHVTKLFGSEVERQAERVKLENEGHTDFEETSKLSELTHKNVPVGTVAAQIVKIMQDSGAGSDAVDKFLQLIVSAMPETSILKSFTARKGTPGYINDVALAFSNVTSSTARQLSRMRYSEQLQRLIDGMVETARGLRGKDSQLGVEFVEEFRARQKYAMNPSIADWARYASSGAFYFNLAGNTSSAVVNLLQTPMVAMPYLGGPYGMMKAGAALLDATKLYMGSGLTRMVTDINGDKVQEKAMLSIENLIDTKEGAKYKDLITRLKELGLLQSSTARDSLEASQRTSAGEGGVRPLSERVASYSAFMFHHAERMNREVTAVAAYNLEMEKSGNKEKAIEKAIRTVEFTHGAGHTESGPSVGHSDIGKVLTVFKRFGFSMYYMLFDTINRAFPMKAGMSDTEIEEMQAARRQLYGIYGMAGIFAGVKGLPLYWVAQMAYDALNDDDEDDFDTVMRKYLGDLLYKGPVNYFTNLAIADRVGWTDLIYRENKGGNADASALSQILESILGAPYAVVNSVFRAKELMDDGHYERAVETMLPVAIRNVLKGGRYAIEGVNTLRGDPVMGDINGYNAAMQVLGFAPADLLKQYEMNAYAKKLEKATVEEGKKLLKQYYVADRSGDYERADDIRKKLFALSDKHGLGITESTINKSVKARDRISDEMYHGVQINKKVRDEFERSIAEMDS